MLSIQAAFAVGWVVWFASIVAAALYALGFAAYAVVVLEQLWPGGDTTPPEWMGEGRLTTLLGLGATALYTLSLLRRSTGGGQLATVGKVVVFAILIGGGVWALSASPIAEGVERLRPFFTGGASGLLQAMGCTFIALQGYDLIAAAGGAACGGLTLFQAVTVPAAGLIAGVWLIAGAVLYVFLFARRARVVDAAAEAADPQLVRLRGRSPLALVPIANPANAAAMVAVANALTPPGVGRVLLLSVVSGPERWQPETDPPQLLDAQAVIRESLTASFAAGLTPEALITISSRPWEEIARVARSHRCESLLLGFNQLTEEFMGEQLERVMSAVDCDVAVLRAKAGWDLAQVRRVLVPVNGRGDHDELRARLLGNLCRTGERDISFLRVLPENASRRIQDGAQQELDRIARDKVPGHACIEVILGDDYVSEISRRAAESDLILLGMRRLSRRRKTFGDLVLQVARNQSCAVMMISQQGYRR